MWFIKLFLSVFFLASVRSFFLPLPLKIPIPFKIPVPVSTEKGRFFILPPPFYYYPRVAPSGPCVTDTKQEGTCTTRSSCNTQGGTSKGSCKGGVCCVFEKTCSQVTQAAVSYFRSPNYPQTSSHGDQCSLSVLKANDKICQLRIDFLQFNISQPTKGECKNDFFKVGDEAVPTICGENSGQHIYVHMDPEKTSLHLSFDTSASSQFNRIWNLKVKQIPCPSNYEGIHKYIEGSDFYLCTYVNSSGQNEKLIPRSVQRHGQLDNVFSPDATPPGCLQYFDGTSGSVSSFNFGKIQSMSDLNYGVCIKNQGGYCSLEWFDGSNNFNLLTDVSEDHESATETTTEKHNEPSSSDCNANFIVIPHPFDGDTALSTDRFCGNSFKQTRTFSKPYVLTVVTKTSPSSQDFWTNSGFKLNFRQLPCKS